MDETHTHAAKQMDKLSHFQLDAVVFYCINEINYNYFIQTETRWRAERAVRYLYLDAMSWFAGVSRMYLAQYSH